jgi:hypothetical protein
MARKPNYSFERNTRAKAKADKREAKRQAKLGVKDEPESPESPVGEDVEAALDADAAPSSSEDLPT